MDKKLLKDIIQWDVKAWSKAIYFWDESIDWSTVNNCLEIGGREGGLSLWLALKGKQVVCSDLTDAAAVAEKLHTEYNVTNRVTYQDIDATNIPYENHFDVIVFKSVLGGVGRNNNYNMQLLAMQQIHKALKPGGKLLFAENLKASGMHRWFRKNFRKWGNVWRYVTMPEISDLTKDFTSVKLHTTGFLSTFGRSEGQRDFLAAADEVVFNKLVPQGWNYIAYGVAEK